jgi:hypothetical protein
MNEQVKIEHTHVDLLYEQAFCPKVLLHNVSRYFPFPFFPPFLSSPLSSSSSSSESATGLPNSTSLLLLCFSPVSARPRPGRCVLCLRFVRGPAIESGDYDRQGGSDESPYPNSAVGKAVLVCRGGRGGRGRG